MHRAPSALVALLGLAVGLAGCADQGSPVDDAGNTSPVPTPAEATQALPEVWYAWTGDDGALSLRPEMDPETGMAGGIQVPADLSRTWVFSGTAPTGGWTETQPALLVIWLNSYHPTVANLFASLEADGQRVGDGMVTVPLTTAGPGAVVDAPQKVELPFEASPVPAGARLTLVVTIDNTDAVERGRGGDWSTILRIGQAA